MSDFKTQLEDIKKKINQKKIEQAKLEQQLDDLEKERVSLNNQLKELKIKDLSCLEAEISKLEIEISQGLEKCQKLLA
jgi:septal ring factor EnvC (AmiA/AmiB activator)